MISLSIDEHGKKKAPFTRPDVPKPEVVGTCEKCGGGTRFEEFTNWNATEGTTRKRIYRCTQHAGRCPAVTVTLGQDGQEEETMAKTKSEGLVCLQTLEWCNQVKAAIIDKHLAYKDVAKDASISQSSLAQGLNMHMSLSEESQKRIEAAVAKAERWESVTARRMAEKRKAKAAADKMPPSLRVSGKTFEAIEAMAKETEETILRNLEAQEALPPGATVTWSEEQSKPGLVQPSEELVIIDVTGPTTFLEEPTGTGKASDAPPPGTLSQLSVMQFQFQGLEQRHKAVECKIDGVAELYYGLEQRHQVLEADVMALQARYHQHEDRLGRMELSQVEAAADAEDQDIANAKRFQDLEDRLTSTYDHLTEQIGKLQPWVVPPPPETSNWSFFSVPAENVRWDPDRIVQELSVYTDSQLAALVTAATARRDLLKSLEAA